MESNKIPDALANLVESKDDIVDAVTRLESLVEVNMIVAIYLFPNVTFCRIYIQNMRIL